MHELSLANRKRDDKAKQCITENRKFKNQIYNGDSYKEQVPLRYPYNTTETLALTEKSENQTLTKERKTSWTNGAIYFKLVLAFTKMNIVRLMRYF